MVYEIANINGLGLLNQSITRISDGFNYLNEGPVEDEFHKREQMRNNFDEKLEEKGPGHFETSNLSSTVFGKFYVQYKNAYLGNNNREDISQLLKRCEIIDKSLNIFKTNYSEQRKKFDELLLEKDEEKFEEMYPIYELIEQYEDFFEKNQKLLAEITKDKHKLKVEEEELVDVPKDEFVNKEETLEID